MPQTGHSRAGPASGDALPVTIHRYPKPAAGLYGFPPEPSQCGNPLPQRSARFLTHRVVPAPSMRGGRCSAHLAGHPEIQSPSMPFGSGGTLRPPGSSWRCPRRQGFFALGVGRGRCDARALLDVTPIGLRFYALGVGQGVATMCLLVTVPCITAFLCPRGRAGRCDSPASRSPASSLSCKFLCPRGRAGRCDMIVGETYAWAALGYGFYALGVGRGVAKDADFNGL
jgi:hypothetical protein